MVTLRTQVNFIFKDAGSRNVSLPSLPSAGIVFAHVSNLARIASSEYPARTISSRPTTRDIYFTVCIVALERCVVGILCRVMDACPVEWFGKGSGRHQDCKAAIESGYRVEIVHARSDERCLGIFVYKPECVILFDFFNGSVALSSGRILRAAERVWDASGGSRKL